MENTYEQHMSSFAGDIFFEKSPVPMWIYDLETLYFLAVNQAAIEKYGYSREEFLNMRLTEIRPDEEVEALIDYVKNHSVDLHFPGIWKHKKKNGELFYVDITAHSFDWNGRKVDHIMANDITKRILAENKQKESEANFKNLFYGSPYAYFLTDEGIIIDCNKSAEAILGGTREEIIGINMSVISPEYQPNGRKSSEMIEEVISETFKKGSHSFEWLHIRFDGSFIIVKVSLSVIEQSGNKVIFNVWKDITQQRKTEEAIKKQEENARILNRMYLNSVSGVAIADARQPDIPLIDVNDAFTRITGYSKEYAIGKNCRYLQGNRRDQAAIETVRNAIKEEKECKVELINFKKSGEMFWNELYLAPVHDSEGKIAHYVGIINDITQRKKEQAELEEYREHLEGMVEQRTSELKLSEKKLLLTQEITNLGTWEFVIASQETKYSAETYNIMERDPALGPLSYEEFLNTLAQKDRERLEKRFAQNIALGKPSQTYAKHTTCKGNIKYLKINAIPIFENGILISIFGSMLDVTRERERAQKLNVAMKAAKAANKAKSEFLANMSHEIRTPLNSIIGFSELLYNNLSDSKERSQVESIRNSGRSLLKIINDILDLSKVEAGRIIIQSEPLNLFRLVHEVGSIFRQKTAEKDLTLNIEAVTDLTSSLMLDETRLRQILFNLIGNAIKFTEKGGIEIIIRHKENVENTVDVEICIKDTGIGISKHQLESIFEPFVQQEGQIHKTYGGTGLGLTISKKLANAMGGDITVKSRLHEGSEFIVSLKNVPMSGEKPVEEDNTFALFSNIRFNGITVLVVDDIPDNRKLLCDALEYTGARILEAENGAMAVEIAKQEIPDIILMDIRMPVMDGMEAAAILKQTPETAHIPCIAVSASVKFGKDGNELPANFDGNLIKPVGFDRLFQLLLKFLKYSVSEAGLPVTTAGATSAAVNIAGAEWSAELKQYAHKELEPTFRHIMKTQLVDDMEDFGNQLLAAGTRFNNESLINAGNRLISSANVFDVKSLSSIMHEFGELLTLNLRV